MKKSDALIELRFTRSRQATPILAWALGFLFCALGFALLHYQRFTHPPSLYWAAIPLCPALLLLWLAWSHLRHPYLALTRVGIEIYPFFLPARNMNLVLWQQIARTEVTHTPPQLVLTRSDSIDAKIFITLEPIAPQQRILLERALQGVQENRESVSREISAASSPPAGLA